MSDLEKQAIIQNAESYSEENLKIFLTTVPYKLLSAEVENRMEKLEILQERGKELFGV